MYSTFNYCTTKPKEGERGKEKKKQRPNDTREVVTEILSEYI
jgi:hypothetical protein